MRHRSPIGTLAIRADYKRRYHLVGDPPGDTRGRVDHPAIERIGLGQIVVTMQVRIDREQPVECGTQQLAKDFRGNGFARMEAGLE